MSSSVYLQTKVPIQVSDWLTFCDSHRMEHSPNTAGGNVFYGGDSGQVEITFGKESENDALPEAANEIDISSYWCNNLTEIAAVGRAIKRRFGCRCIGASPEVPVPKGWEREFEHEE